jgi:uncharacterized membrane protein
MATRVAALTRVIPIPRESSANRILAIDALRGVALAVMALEHAAFFSGAGVTAETYGGHPAVLESWPHWISGLLTNLSTPTFWLLSGVSMALFVASRRKRHESEWSITRYLLTRASLILLLDLSLVNALLIGKAGAYYHALTGLAVSMALLSILRLLPLRAFLALTLGVLLGYQGLLGVIEPHLGQPQGFWQALWLTYRNHPQMALGFPVLGWFSLMGLGFVLGQRLSSPTLQRPRTWVGIGGILLSIWLALRLAGGYGDLTPYVPGAHWYYFLIMSKVPPSLSYQSFNLGLSALIFAALCDWNGYLELPPLQWLVAYGQVPLFFFIVHIAIYRVLGTIARALPLPIPGLVRSYIVWLIGLMVLVPLARGYRRLRQSHPNSPLRYL